MVTNNLDGPGIELQREKEPCDHVLCLCIRVCILHSEPGPCHMCLGGCIMRFMRSDRKAVD